jgi:hypothetical protein
MSPTEHRPFSSARTLRGVGLWVFVMLASAAASVPSLAQDAGFLGKLPEPDEVFARFEEGGDLVQTIGRQCAALDMLERRFFRAHAVMTPAVRDHPETVRVRENYKQGFNRLHQRYEAAVGGMDDEKRRIWSAMCENRVSPGGLRQRVSLDEVLAIVPADVVATYDAAHDASNRRDEEKKTAAKARAEAVIQAEQDKIARDVKKKWQLRWNGLVVLAIGLIPFIFATRIMRRLNKYEIENTTDGGVVAFDNFNQARRHELLRKVFGGSFLIGTGMLAVVGIGMLIVSLA